MTLTMDFKIYKNFFNTKFIEIGFIKMMYLLTLINFGTDYYYLV
jgi:hypothetical protein